MFYFQILIKSDCLTEVTPLIRFRCNYYNSKLRIESFEDFTASRLCRRQQSPTAQIWNPTEPIGFLDTIRVEGKFNINFGESNLHEFHKEPFTIVW